MQLPSETEFRALLSSMFKGSYRAKLLDEGKMVMLSDHEIFEALRRSYEAGFAAGEIA